MNSLNIFQNIDANNFIGKTFKLSQCESAIFLNQTWEGNIILSCKSSRLHLLKSSLRCKVLSVNFNQKNETYLIFNKDFWVFFWWFFSSDDSSLWVSCVSRCPAFLSGVFYTDTLRSQVTKTQPEGMPPCANFTAEQRPFWEFRSARMSFLLLTFVFLSIFCNVAISYAFAVSPSWLNYPLQGSVILIGWIFFWGIPLFMRYRNNFIEDSHRSQTSEQAGNLRVKITAELIWIFFARKLEYIFICTQIQRTDTSTVTNVSIRNQIVTKENIQHQWHSQDFLNLSKNMRQNRRKITESRCLPHFVHNRHRKFAFL